MNASPAKNKLCFPLIESTAGALSASIHSQVSANSSHSVFRSLLHPTFIYIFSIILFSLLFLSFTQSYFIFVCELFCFRGMDYLCF